MRDAHHFHHGRVHGRGPESHGHGRGFGHEHPLEGGRGRGGGGSRVFAHGGLRFVLLQLIADKPSHGYELIKQIEDRMQGRYSPSPGVIYPALTWLEDLGHTAVTAESGGRKLYTVTDAGREYLQANREAADAMMARMGDAGNSLATRPPQVVRALENLKLAVRMRLSRAPLTEEQANAFAAVLDTAAQNLERL